MKKSLFTLFVLLICGLLAAQFVVWRNGEIVFQTDINEVDSITLYELEIPGDPSDEEDEDDDLGVYVYFNGAKIKNGDRIEVGMDCFDRDINKFLASFVLKNRSNKARTFTLKEVRNYDCEGNSAILWIKDEMQGNDEKIETWQLGSVEDGGKLNFAMGLALESRKASEYSTQVTISNGKKELSFTLVYVYEQLAMPYIEEVEGAYVIVAQFQTKPCNDVIFAGSYKLADGSQSAWGKEPAAKFEAIEGYDGWYKVVVYPLDVAEDAGYDADGSRADFLLRGKPVQLTADGVFDWSYQWARNSVEVLDGDFILGDENGGGQFIGFTGSKGESKVVYVTSTGWATDPCAAAIPAGYGTFIINIAEGSYVSEDATFSIAGNFAEEAWNNSRVMTEVEKGKKYIWTGDYPENFQFKAIQTVDGKDIWAEGDNAKFDGETYEYTFSFQNYYEPEEPTTKNITVKAKVPAHWTDEITAWVWPTDGEGHEVYPIKEGDWYVVTEYCEELNIIFKNGEEWTSVANQSVDITGITENCCLELYQEGSKKAEFTIVDCGDLNLLDATVFDQIFIWGANRDAPYDIVLTQQDGTDTICKAITAVLAMFPSTMYVDGEGYMAGDGGYVLFLNTAFTIDEASGVWYCLANYTVVDNALNSEMKVRPWTIQAAKFDAENYAAYWTQYILWNNDVVDEEPSSDDYPYYDPQDSYFYRAFAAEHGIALLDGGYLVLKEGADCFVSTGNHKTDNRAMAPTAYNLDAKLFGNPNNFGFAVEERVDEETGETIYVFVDKDEDNLFDLAEMIDYNFNGGLTEELQAAPSALEKARALPEKVCIKNIAINRALHVALRLNTR